MRVAVAGGAGPIGAGSIGADLGPVHRATPSGDIRKGLADLAGASGILGHEPGMQAHEGL